MQFAKGSGHETLPFFVVDVNPVFRDADSRSTRSALRVRSHTSRIETPQTELKPTRGR